MWVKVRKRGAEALRVPPGTFVTESEAGTETETIIADEETTARPRPNLVVTTEVGPVGEIEVDPGSEIGETTAETEAVLGPALTVAMTGETTVVTAVDQGREMIAETEADPRPGLTEEKTEGTEAVPAPATPEAVHHALGPIDATARAPDLDHPVGIRAAHVLAPVNETAVRDVIEVEVVRGVALTSVSVAAIVRRKGTRIGITEAVPALPAEHHRVLAETTERHGSSPRLGNANRKPKPIWPLRRRREKRECPSQASTTDALQQQVRDHLI